MMADPSATPIEATTRPDAGRLFAALELGKSRWLVTVDAPGSDKLSRHAVAGGDGAALLDLLARLRRTAERRTGRPVEVLVIQEAGLDGFWLHRLLERNGISSHVVDPASIAVNRRHRRAKTDTIDGEMLLRSLMARARGERRVCSMVRPPSPEEEDRRRLTRERATLLKERIQHTNRIKGLLYGQGIIDYDPLRKDRLARLDALETGDGRPLPERLKAESGGTRASFRKQASSPHGVMVVVKNRDFHSAQSRRKNSRFRPHHSAGPGRIANEERKSPACVTGR